MAGEGGVEGILLILKYIRPSVPWARGEGGRGDETVLSCGCLSLFSQSFGVKPANLFGSPNFNK